VSAYPQQLSLGVSLKDDATFENFYAPADSPNAQVVAAIQAQLTPNAEPFIYVWGGSGVGLTHLLQASCHQAEEAGLAVQYLPLRELVGFAPEALLDGLENLDLICIDSLDAVAGKGDWELALFTLYNALRDTGGRLLLAAEQGPRELPLALADLRSRLQWGLVFQVQGLNDADKQRALRQRASRRGLTLNEEVASYIIQRSPRDMNQLFCYLNRLDDASLSEQRKLTIPFVKKILGL